MSTNEQTPLESFIDYKADTGMQCGNYQIDIEKPKEGEQYRFHFDATACVGCHCCEVACNEQNNNPSDIKWRRVAETQSGIFPNVTNHFNSMSCNHCIEPECLIGCPTESYIKFDNGIVYHEDESCIGCQYCTWNCPYEVPVFNQDRGIVTKCHMCHDKLEVGQTPACVQACPAGAIEIEVVNTKEWLDEKMQDDGVAPHLPNIDITKPTTRYTLSDDEKNAKDVKPADEHIIKPNHSEWPLVFMTVLSQISVGGFAALFLGELANFLGFNLAQPSLLLLIALFIPIAIGLPLSALHLGRPLLALTAMKNIKSSWLSREALALGVYAGGLTLLLPIFFFEFNQFLKLIVEVGVLGAGIYGIYAQSMIYRIKARPSWNKKETTKIFFYVSYIGLLLVSLTLIVNEAYSSASVILPFALFIAYFQMEEFNKQTSFYNSLDEKIENFYSLNKTKKLYEEFFSKYTDFRKFSLYIGSLALPLLCILLLASGNYGLTMFFLTLAIIISFSSEIISRLLFYKTAVSIGIAGNFFAGNQR